MGLLDELGAQGSLHMGPRRSKQGPVSEEVAADSSGLGKQGSWGLSSACAHSTPGASGQENLTCVSSVNAIRSSRETCPWGQEGPGCQELLMEVSQSGRQLPQRLLHLHSIHGLPGEEGQETLGQEEGRRLISGPWKPPSSFPPLPWQPLISEALWGFVFRIPRFHSGSEKSYAFHSISGKLDTERPQRCWQYS